MAGENDCSVTINFSDGTYIERGRSVKDTGYYKIRYIDDNGKYIDQTYRGFTNAVPVEVANVHQMPKVNITKDIETKLKESEFFHSIYCGGDWDDGSYEILLKPSKSIQSLAERCSKYKSF